MAKRKNPDVETELRRILEEGEPLRTRQPSFVGNRCGVSVSVFLDAIFRYNEKAPQDAKLTDEMIVERVKEEYSKHEPTVKTFGKRNSLSTYRGKFNRGKMTQSLPTSPARPRIFSVSYDAEGFPLYNKKRMTRTEYLLQAVGWGLGVTLEDDRCVIHTTEHFGVVPIQLFKLKKTDGKTKAKKPARV